jgi:hypothetical protein
VLSLSSGFFESRKPKHSVPCPFSAMQITRDVPLPTFGLIALMMEASRISETSVYFNETTQRYKDIRL